MLPVNGYQKTIQKEIGRLINVVDYDLSHIHPEKIEKYTVLHQLHQDKASTLYGLCDKVDVVVYGKLIVQIQKIEKKLATFKETIEFFDSKSDATDPRICKITAKLEKICNAHGFFGEEETEQMHEKITLCRDALEDFSPKFKDFNANTQEAIEYASELIAKSRKTVDFLLENSKVFNFNNNSDNESEVSEDNYSNDSESINNQCSNYEYKISEYHPPKVDIRNEKIVICLQKTIDFLSLGTEEGFFQAIEYIGELNAVPFNENRDQIETKGKTLGDRIFFHLYLIHKKESPHLINPSDMNYGSTAFQTEDGSTAVERKRAAQRVLADVCINALEHSYIQGDLDVFTQVLEILEEMNLDAKDMPPSVKNLTHGLFGKMYNDYLKAYESKDEKAGYESSWVHPHDPMFKGDFGRNAFMSGYHDYKLQVIKEFVKSVKENWGV